MAAPGTAGTATSPSPPPRVSSSLNSAGREKRRAGLSLYAVLREVQYLLAIWLGFCPSVTNSYRLNKAPLLRQYFTTYDVNDHAKSFYLGGKTRLN